MDKAIDKTECIQMLKAQKSKLTHQQYSTIKGQILAGDTEGAKKGLDKLLRRKVVG